MARERKSIERVSWYRMHPAQWLHSYQIRCMNWAQRGVYKHLLDIAWMEGDAHPKWRASIPADDAWIATQLGMSVDEWLREHKNSVLKCFTERNGRLWNRVLKEEADDAQTVISAGREAANKRWKKDGYPLGTHMGTHCQPNGYPMHVPDLTVPNHTHPTASGGGGKGGIRKRAEERLKGILQKGVNGNASTNGETSTSGPGSVPDKALD